MQTASINNGFDFHGAEAFFSEGFFDRGLEHGKAADKKRIGQADFQEQHFFDQIARIFIRIDVVGVLVFDANLLDSKPKTVRCDRGAQFVALADGINHCSKALC